MIIFILGLILCCERRLQFRKNSKKLKEPSYNDIPLNLINKTSLENEKNTNLLEELKNYKEMLSNFYVNSIESELAQLELCIFLSKNNQEMFSDKSNLAIYCYEEGIRLFESFDQKIKENMFVGKEDILLVQKIKYQIFKAYLHLFS
ncbi:hypothetical protein TUBRATIS_30510 [Tubulinosema ratisbonensis]|uniref:Uncharacterized protein n=1 Tax=Tubulinosema ratisbonensis TaxID=291195 RepID=A0A437AHD7_9MICR|nr:hypothetical protein TUBRATIS_30510 [Tubulinosema ratisbonensis]